MPTTRLLVPFVDIAFGILWKKKLNHSAACVSPLAAVSVRSKPISAALGVARRLWVWPKR